VGRIRVGEGEQHLKAVKERLVGGSQKESPIERHAQEKMLAARKPVALNCLRACGSNIAPSLAIRAQMPRLPIAGVLTTTSASRDKPRDL
jgi:hypothetical protein